jgi:predicted nucleotidyltransferase
MLQKNNREKVLEKFLKHPTTEFGLREISRETKISPASVKRYLHELEKEKIIQINSNRKEQPVYIANRDNEEFQLNQKIYMQKTLQEIGLIDYIWQELSPKAIILFGSWSKGDAVETSDIDIFILTKSKKELNLDKFQDKLHHEIQTFPDDLKKSSKEFKNNLINGIILKGYLKIL